MTAPLSGGGSAWVRASAPATSANLGPGFDALGLALEWREEVDARLLPRGAGVCVQVSGPAAAEVPADRTNLAARGAAAVLAAAGEPAGIELRLHLRLPVGGGLGSSAAAIACGLVAANRLAGGLLSVDDLVDAGAEIEGHPDNVAPALLGGLCVACRSEASPGRTLAVRLAPPQGLIAVVAVPALRVRTQNARAVLPEVVSFRDAVANVQRACLLVAAVAAGRLDLLGEATRDRLHQPYRGRLVPGLEAALEQARAAGAAGAFLSGAGPTLLALVGKAGPARLAVHRALAAAVDRMGGGEVREVSLASRGALVVPLQA